MGPRPGQGLEEQQQDVLESRYGVSHAAQVQAGECAVPKIVVKERGSGGAAREGGE